MKKGIRIIERMLRVDKIAEEAERWGDERAFGGKREEILVMAPIKWVAIIDGKSMPLFE